MARTVFELFSGVKPKWKLRKDILAEQQIPIFSKRPIWIHCASAGEFQQIIPVVEELNKLDTSFLFLFSFFSPSGLEWLKIKNYNYPSILLPFDSKKKMKNLVHQINPQAFILVRNELWFNLLEQVHELQIPSFMVAARFEKKHFALRYAFFKKMLAQFSILFTEDHPSKINLQSVNVECTFGGNPRIDHLISRKKTIDRDRTKTSFKRKPIIIYGSVHRSDAHIISQIKNHPDFIHWIFPHEINEEELIFFNDLLNQGASFHSTIKRNEDQIIIFNRMGLLTGAYQYADYAYIGGGFKEGIHNILEPALFENIIFFGPKYSKFVEAKDLLKNQAVIALKREESLFNRIHLLGESHKKEMKQAMDKYFSDQKGKSTLIANKIHTILHE